jgi:hypothetical protein
VSEKQQLDGSLGVSVTHPRETSTLATAISAWRAGRSISLVLFTKLVEEGYDVASLERFYRR